MEETDLWRLAGQDPGVNLLVWGPGELSPNYAIRLAVKEALQQFFVRGKVLFSEDDDSPAQAPNSWLGRIAVRERLQAARASTVYIIPTSPGAKLELILFSRYREVAGKLHVLLPRRHEDHSFVGRVFADSLASLPAEQVRGFDDFDAATVAEYCLTHAKAWYMREHPEGPPSLV